MPHKFSPERIARLLSPERERQVRPGDLLARFGLAPGQVMVDVGCGPGFFALPAARIVGSAGKVLACDIQQVMLDALIERASAEGLAQVVPILSGEDSLPLDPACADFALLANALHECVHPVALLREVARVLRPGRRMAIIEWRPEFTDFGPPVQERLAPERAADFLGQAGLVPSAPEILGPEAYAITAERP